MLLKEGEIKTRVGRYLKGSSVGGEAYKTYIPKNLPPDPPLEMAAFYPFLDKANIALGKLEGISMILPDPSLFLYMYIRKEAVLSSQIEGTQSSLSDLLLFESDEAPGAPIDDVTEVSCYVAAMNYGLERLRKFPLSLRLLREIHDRLMSNSRGGNKMPGEFRTSQNWIGGTRPGNALFVPPPPEKMMDCLDNFEKFLHDEKIKMPVLIKAALAHAQFETIHPFLDGNGRLGRLLITFILCSEGVLREPLLYLSLYLKSNRKEYYDHLQKIRETGDWESWVIFFLKGVIETAEQAAQTAQSIRNLFISDQMRIETSGNTAASTLTVFNLLQRHPISKTTKMTELSNLSLPTVLRALNNLEEMGIVKEITGKDRHKVFVYEAYLATLNEGTNPIAA
ncbi:Fic family protein [Yunchengibacter salinarum]|uniref:Fic family protein n=1 Tax=Yunchengibacter salinarum TaxID=3133399 RepID=UPI0035B678E4